MLAESDSSDRSSSTQSGWLSEHVLRESKIADFAKNTAEEAQKFVGGLSTGQEVAAVAVLAGAVFFHSRAGANLTSGLVESIPGVRRLPPCNPVETMAIYTGEIPKHFAWSSRQQSWYKALPAPSGKPIPEFTDAGFLPPGVHPATWSQMVDRFGHTPERRVILDNMRLAVSDLKEAGAKRIYVGGSLVTKKPVPGDFDLGWLSNGVAESARARPEFNVYGSKSKYGGDIFQNVIFGAHYGKAVPGGAAKPIQDFLRHNMRVGKDVGVILLDLSAPL